jgi:hypothetical protein
MRIRMAMLVLLSSLLASEGAFAQDKSKDSGAGDLGLDELEQHPVESPKSSIQAGIGVNATLAPSFFGTAVVAPSLSLRLWFERLMIEPVLGIAFQSAQGMKDASFGLNAGALIGYALKTGNLRPILGGGMTLAVTTGGGTTTGFTFGPMVGFEYHFNELPNLGLEAAVFLPMRMQFDPFVFSFQTTGGALIGFHYFFSG